jgi:hypothetical protein
MRALRLPLGLLVSCLAWAIVQGGTPAHAVAVVSGSTRQYDGDTYCLLTVSTWPEAEAYAESLGGHLAVINNAAENQWVYDTYAPLLSTTFLLIGLFQPDGSVEPDGGWQWVDGTPLTYTAWQPGEPNNQSGDEKYTHLIFDTAVDEVRWNDAPLTSWATYQGVVEFGSNATSFADVPSDYWAYTAVTACAEAGIVNGYPDGLYHPADDLRRSQMAVFIARALAGGDFGVPSGPAVATFPDVPASGYGEDNSEPYWAYRYIEYCAAHSIVSGYWDGYRPEELVNRGQMAVYVARSVVDPTGETGLAGYTPPTAPSFPDVPPDYWAYKHIEYCKAQAIIAGYWDGYHPEETVNRAQMAVYVARAFALLP